MAAYFGFAERHKGLLEENLAGVFGRPVSIESLQTTWVGRSPSMQITGLQVQGDGGGPALAFNGLPLDSASRCDRQAWSQGMAKYR